MANAEFKNDASEPALNRETYEKNGYWLEENVFSDEQCQQMIEAAKSLSSYTDRSYRPMMMPHRHNPLYLQAIRHPRIIASMEEAVGGRPMGLQTEFFYCRPGTHGFSMHQDNFFVEAPMGAFASAWCALTDAYEENGGLILWPGSHKEGLLPVRKLAAVEAEGQDPNARNEEAIVPERYKPVNIRVPKGAVLYMHGHVVHASHVNRSQQWRYALLITYIRAGQPFRPGRYALREAIPL